MNIECGICLENLQVTEDIYSTPCGHVFHFPCICQWFEMSSACPECREEVPDEKLTRVFLNFVSENNVIKEFTLTPESEIKSLRHQLTVKDEMIAQCVAKEQELCERINMLQETIEFLTTIMKQSIDYLLNR